jgi:nucleoside-diphosphate-sugar epimerase
VVTLITGERRRRMRRSHRSDRDTEPRNGDAVSERRKASAGGRGREDSGYRVAITGAGTPVGRAVAQAWARQLGDPTGPAHVIAVDEEEISLDGVSWRRAAVTDPGVAEMLVDADVVIHIANGADLHRELSVSPKERRAHAVRAVQATSTAAAAVGARRFVLVSSAMVYGAREDNPVPLPDDAPLRAEPGPGVVGDLLEVERIVGRVRRTHPGLATTILRPAALVGPGVDTMVTRHFEAPRLLSVRGMDTQWQFCHVADLARAVVVAVQAEMDGALGVGADGSLGREAVEAVSGMRKVELPAGLAFGTAERLQRLGLVSVPAADLAYVVHPWVVSAERLREAGWTPERDNPTCLETLIEDVRGRVAIAGLRLERRDAALGAAGAAVAVVATAAVLRQARARRNRRGRPTL